MFFTLYSDGFVHTISIGLNHLMVAKQSGGENTLSFFSGWVVGWEKMKVCFVRWLKLF
jgi:hypothetical protein